MAKGYVHFSFETAGFKDSPETKAENINELAGHALAIWLAGELTTRGFAVSKVWPEDHGWDFDISSASKTLLCACSINEDDQPLGDAHVVLGSKASPDHPVVVAVGEVLKVCKEVQNLSVD